MTLEQLYKKYGTENINESMKILTSTLPHLTWFSFQNDIPNMFKKLEKIGAKNVPWEFVVDVLYEYQWQREYLPLMYRDRSLFNKTIELYTPLQFTTQGVLVQHETS